VTGVESASVTTYSGRGFATVAATDESASHGDQLQYDRGSGPCIAAILEEPPHHHLRDLRRDDRWPTAARTDAVALGIISALSVRLTPATPPGASRMGPAPGAGAANIAAGLNLYASRPDAFNPEAVAMALLLSTHARTALRAANNTAHIVHLEQSQRTTQQIGAAVGVLMVTRELGHDEAMNLLRTTSQRTNTRVSELAEQVIATGTLPRIKNRGPRPNPR
jgi:hypothetical protein